MLLDGFEAAAKVGTGAQEKRVRDLGVAFIYSLELPPSGIGRSTGSQVTQLTAMAAEAHVDCMSLAITTLR